jgi:hypothetical protein
MVTFKGVTRFYSRNSSGKYPLDIFEIRSAFLASESLPERLARFRNLRLAAIVAGEAPVTLSAGGKIVLHCVPIMSLDPAEKLDLPGMSNILTPLLRPMGNPSSWTPRFNFDGFLTRSATSSNYAQIFRSGAIEAVETTLLPLTEFRRETNSRPPDFISFTDFERQVIGAVSRYTQLQKRIGITPPIYILVTLLGVKGFKVTTGPTLLDLSVDSIDRDTLFLPDMVMDEFADEAGASEQAGALLKPVFDALAQAAGLPKSRNYDENGKRSER